MPKVYLIGALKNRDIMEIAERIRKVGLEVFDDWITPGPEADGYLDEWRKKRGLTYSEALRTHAAKHIFEFDKHHIDDSDIVVLAMPAGKSAHLELGYAAGKGKKTYILFDKEPDRMDIMYQFVDKIFMNEEELISELEQYSRTSGDLRRGPDTRFVSVDFDKQGVITGEERPGGVYAWYTSKGWAPYPVREEYPALFSDGRHSKSYPHTETPDRCVCKRRVS